MLVDMSNIPVKIMHVLRGTPAPLNHDSAVITAINRHKVLALRVFLDHIEGDEVANKIHHGGPQRVLHQYPNEHYAFWETLYPETRFEPGSMGENLCATSMTEKDVCIGDVYKIGEVVCIVTEPRKPCATINQKYKVKGLARKVQDESRTGWFYRIQQEGTIRPGDSIELQERPFPKLTVETCIQALLVKPDRSMLELLVHNPVLSENWKNPARVFLNTGVLPDDRPRLGEMSPH